MTEKIRKTDSEWRQILTPEQYQVARRKGTEPPGTGEYEDTDEPGTYACVCCGPPLIQFRIKISFGIGMAKLLGAHRRGESRSGSRHQPRNDA